MTCGHPSLPDVVARAWARWKAIAHVIGNFQGRVRLSVFYFIVVPRFALVVKLFKDPLGLRLPRADGFRIRRPAPGRAALFVAFAWLAHVGLVEAQTPSISSDVEFVFLVDLHNPEEWIRFHEEVLGTPRDLPRSLLVAVVAKRGERRSVTVESPRFTAEIAQTEQIKITVVGRVTGARALQALTIFEQAVLDMQAGVVENQVTLTYG